MRVSFHPAADAEVEHAQAWYEERSVLAAAGFLQELTRAVQRVREAPERYLPPDTARVGLFSITWTSVTVR